MFPQLSISGFSPGACKALARAAQAAYSKASEIESLALASGALDFVFFSDDEIGTQAFAARRGSRIVIAFRGSEESADWRTNTKIRRVDWLGGSVHRGFLRAFLSVGYQLSNYVRAQHRGSDALPEIWITGHSLGGALAILCATQLREELNHIAGVYTFGQPRVGGRDFAKNYERELGAKTFRLVNQEDAVPRIPFWHHGYRHCGAEIFLDSFGSVQVKPSLLSRLPSHIWGFAKEMDVVFPLTSTVSAPVKKHSMASYIERLSRA